MLYYLILLFQGICIYHAFRNHKPYYWFFLIFFLPVIGCLIYIFTQIFNKSDIDKAQRDLTLFVNPTKRVTDLEKNWNSPILLRIELHLQMHIWTLKE